MWLLLTLVIEGMALLGVVSVWSSRGTWGAFLAGFNTMGLVTGIFLWYGGTSPRSLLILGMVAVYLLHINWMLLRWTRQTAVSKLDRHTPLSRKLFLPIVLANTMGWGYCLPIYFAIGRADPVSVVDAVGIALYLVGTAFHLGADYQKRRFKLQPGSEGRLLDSGFWALSRHPNYFGDFLIYLSLAVLGGRIWGWISPLLNLLQYAFDAIPSNESWASQRYGKAWEDYKSRTKAFVPFLI